MITAPSYNCIDFTSDFARESKFFDASLQRKKGLISQCEAYLSFEFTPDTMPEAAPQAVLTFFNDNGSEDSINHEDVIELTSSFIYFFDFSTLIVEGEGYLRLQITGYDDVVFSERCEFINNANLAAREIVTVIASNNDDRHGYISDYPTCGFFEVHGLNGDQFGNSKVEYSYSYGRKKTLSSENFIKKRLTFIGLSMYQQNLIKWLCNCENLTIDGVSYCLVSDFTEKLKDENNEICDLQAEFVPVVANQFTTSSTSAPTRITPSNLFI